MAQTLTQEDLDAIALAVHSFSSGGIVGMDTFKWYWTNAADEAAAAVWSELMASYTSTGTFGAKVAGLNAITGLVVPRVNGTTLTAFVGETYTHTITTVDGDGNAVDCSGMTLEVIIEKLDRTDIVTIANANITKTSTTVAFAVSSTYHTTEANYRWAMRRTDTGVVIMHGTYVVQYAADN